LKALPPDDEKFLTKLIACGCIGVFAAGHEHIDTVERIGKGEVHLVRGIDPDKAMGGPPALTFFEYDSDARRWERGDCVYPAGCTSSWTEPQRVEFWNLLGISCMGDSLGGIAAAIRHDIRSVEIRFACPAADSREELCNLVEQWRNQGGQYLSIHLPSIAWDREANAVKGADQVKAACELALELGADVLTMHVPRCPVGIIADNSEVRETLLQAYAEALSMVLKQGLTVGIENMHMNPGEEPGTDRGFGYTPAECLAWISALRKLTRSENIGFHFDIGHARNNAPYSSLYNISQWFAETGSLITGYHLHQVEQDAAGNLFNHRPVTGMFGPVISFSSLFAAWNQGQINHAPMYLEIRDASALASLECFRRHLSS
jgi:sugar phosphate isomerase/epimerase